MPTIRISAGPVTVFASLGDSPTARDVLAALPITGRASTWGDEIYFGIPVHADEEPGASAVVNAGDIAYWPPGSALCLFFGPTPASRGNEFQPPAPSTRSVGSRAMRRSSARWAMDPVRVDLVGPEDPQTSA